MRVRSMDAFITPQRKQLKTIPETESMVQSKGNATVQINKSYDIQKLFSSFGKDDYILAGLLLVLFFEGCDDYILLAALGYLFIMGII